MDTPKDIETACAWTAKARNDLLNASNNMTASEIPYDTVCFHCQQAVEKLMKVVLASHGVAPGRTHDLMSLREALHRIHFKTDGIDTLIPLLIDYAVEARYPDYFDEITDLDAIEAFQAAQTVWRWFESTAPELFARGIDLPVTEQKIEFMRHKPSHPQQQPK